MKHILALAAVSLLLSGCAVSYTLTDLQKNDPIIQYTSSKGVRSVTACISRKWVDHNFAGQPHTLLTATGYLLLFTAANNPVAVASIEPDGAGCRVSYTDTGAYIVKDLQTEVRDCR